MIDKKIKTDCTGCTACFNVCPYSAIEMKMDEEGFRYPRVKEEYCVECGLCLKVCPVLRMDKKIDYIEPKVYAGWNLDEEIRINSTSGGVFSALALTVLEKGGVVVGASYDNDFTVNHELIKSKEEIVKLRQSKYTQSNLQTIFREVKVYLDKKVEVLFCGTPCQSAGLQQYLMRDYDNLYCCDFICRGVTSPKVYKKYLADLSRSKKSSIKKIQFKNKDYGWNQFTTKILFENGSLYQKDRNDDLYMRGYLRHNLYLRPSCHNCYYKIIPRVSDLSLGDFWGIGNYQDYLDTNKGTSVILVNSEKGKKLLDQVRDKLFLELRSIEEVTNGNSCLLNSAEKGKYREYFFLHFSRKSFDKLIKSIEKKERLYRLIKGNNFAKK